MTDSKLAMLTASGAAAWLLAGLARLRGLQRLEAAGVEAAFGVSLRRTGTPASLATGDHDGAPVALALRLGPGPRILQSGHCQESIFLDATALHDALGALRETDETELVRPRDGGPCHPRPSRLFEVDLPAGVLRLRGVVQGDGRVRFTSFALEQAQP